MNNEGFKLITGKETVFEAAIKNEKTKNVVFKIRVIPESGCYTIRMSDSINLKYDDIVVSKGSFKSFERCMRSLFDQMKKEKE